MGKFFAIFIIGINFYFYSQEQINYPFTKFKFGDSPGDYTFNSEDITNPEALDEITLLYKGTLTVFGQTSKKTKLHFFNNRLTKIEMDLIMYVGIILFQS